MKDFNSHSKTLKNGILKVKCALMQCGGKVGGVQVDIEYKMIGFW